MDLSTLENKPTAAVNIGACLYFVKEIIIFISILIINLSLLSAEFETAATFAASCNEQMISIQQIVSE
jgi:hypothetical protein